MPPRKVFSLRYNGRVKRILLTGFKPFLDNASNPTETLSLSNGGIVLEVTYQAVDELLTQDLSAYDLLLCLGLHAKADKPRIERFAYNEKTNKKPDMQGLVPIDLTIDPKSPARLETELDVNGLVNHLQAKGFDCLLSEDPGRYLCNYIYFNALKKKDGRVLFIHFPAETKDWTLEKMDALLKEAIAYLS